MTKEEMREFRKLFGKYCNQETSNGRCAEDSCDTCPVNDAYEEIFNYFFDDEEEDDAE